MPRITSEIAMIFNIRSQYMRLKKKAFFRSSDKSVDYNQPYCLINSEPFYLL